MRCSEATRPASEIEFLCCFTDGLGVYHAHVLLRCRKVRCHSRSLTSHFSKALRMSPDQVSRPIRIALVDDHPTVLWGLEKLIESASSTMTVVASAKSPAELLSALKKELLDLDLGEENGLDLVSHARRSGARVVILTGLRDTDTQQRAMLAGACGFLNKTVPAEVILRAIECVHHGEIWLDRQMTAQVMASFHERGNTGSGRDDKVVLTAAERKVIAAVTKHKALPNKAIADILHISAHTLRNHLATIYEKLRINRRVDLVFYALENGLDAEPASPRSAAQRYARSRRSPTVAVQRGF